MKAKAPAAAKSNERTRRQKPAPPLVSGQSDRDNNPFVLVLPAQAALLENSQTDNSRIWPAEPSDDRSAATEFAVAVMDGPAVIVMDDTAESSQPVVLIEIDPDLSGGYARDRFDVTLRGRVLSPAEIVEIRLQVDGTTFAVASLTDPERAARKIMPDGTDACQRTFQFHLPRRGSDQAEHFGCDVIARTRGGVERAETFTLAFDPAAETAISIVSGPVKSGASFGGIKPHAVMYLERGSIDADGNLAVEGWALALGPINVVQIFAGETPVAAAHRGATRNDVGAAYPFYPNARLSGFSLTTYLDEADVNAATIRAQLICANGFSLEETIPVEFIEGSAAPAPSGQPRLATDTLAAAHAPMSRLPTQGPAALGYSAPEVHTPQLRVPELHAPQLHPEATTAGVVTALAANPPTRAKNGGNAPAAATVDEQVSSEIKMFCDIIDLKIDGTLFLSGWAICAAGIAQIKVFLNDKEIGLGQTGQERSDVGAIYKTIPMAMYSGFRFETRLPERLAGNHIVRIVVRNTRDEVKEDVRSVVAAAVAAELMPPPPEPSPAAEPPPSPAAEAPSSPAAEPPSSPAAEPPSSPAAELPSSPTAEPPASPQQEAEFRFELDAPAVLNGAVTETISGRLTIEGWLLSRSGIARFQAFLDDQCLGDVHYGLARQDVGVTFPEWPNSLRSGYAFHCPPRCLRDGQHTIRLLAVANSGQEISRSFQITVRKADDQTDVASIRRRVPPAETALMTGLLADMTPRPSFCVLLRVAATVAPQRLDVTLETLVAQALNDWSVLVLAEDDATASAVRLSIDESVPHLASRFSIVCATDQTLWDTPLADQNRAATPTHYLLLNAGDAVGADALLEFAVASALNPTAGLLYGDEVRESPVSGEKEPFFKPDYSPDLLASTNYIGRPWIASAAVLAATGVTPASLSVDGEYDLVLRLTEVADHVFHLPKLMCERSGRDLDDVALQQAALRRMLARRAIDAQVLPTTIPGTWRVKRVIGAKGKVSIIIPTCAAHGYIETCIKTLRARTTYPDYEIIVIDNIPESRIVWKVWVQQNADKVVDIPTAFNWSVFNNRAAEAADGDYLLFLNDDIEITQDDWLDAMMEQAQRPEVGITGPQLLYPDGKVQHAGMFLASNGIGRHAFRFAAGDDPAYFGLALTQRNVMAVTGACMLVRADTFERLGRFDEAHEITNNDLDFCLRAHREGLLTVFTPYASLVHHELASRAMFKDVFDLTHFDHSWKTMFAAGDPYFNPRLSRHADDFRPDDEPVQWVIPGAPLFHAEEIKRILVVKLDHIGDFVTALPPIRRLKEIFPHATITVLAGPASRALASLEPCIDTFIPFAFFHARSQLGERQVERSELIELQDRLRPCRFDLAIDLRKHLSTRDVLKFAGARFLVGFDYLGQCPFLDIALDWDGDRTLQRKRSHIVDDLLALVDAVGRATETNRLLMQPPPPPMPVQDMPDAVRALFTKAVVAIHPGAGNITKQWPAEHFSALIDLLTERQDVNIVLVGGPDEVEVAELLLGSVKHPGAIASMAGKTSLSDLPRLLRNCALYIGNDSGPKHIASAIGMPTIGIHSGVVDPVEWGPFGPQAIALRRNMTCSPCYLANADDCPRSLACLRFLEPNLVYEAATMLLKRGLNATERDIQRIVRDTGKTAPADLVSKIGQSDAELVLMVPDQDASKGKLGRRLTSDIETKLRA